MKTLISMWFLLVLAIASVHGFGNRAILRKTNYNPVRVRFAPSPTGSLHIGGARTALYNWLIAKKTGGTFIVRVEDTDEERSTKASETSILNDLKWLGLDWDEGPEIGGVHGPYRQSERKHIYKKYADQLLAEGKAYKCFCTEEELEEQRLAAEAAGIDSKYDGTWRNADPEEVRKRTERGDPFTIRFRVPTGKIVSVDDKVRGRVVWDADACLGDFIILRSSGMPVYNFCVSVDDMDMRISHVIRAEEHLSNTLRQLLILEALNYKPPTYAHCSLILGADKSKLSKRHGATSVSQFCEQGYIPSAMLNYLATIGWNDGTDQDIYSPKQLIESFSLNGIIKSAAVFDIDKLKWINGQHLRTMKYPQLLPVVLKDLCAPSRNQSSDDNVTMNPSVFLPEVEQRFNETELKDLFNATSRIAQRDMVLTVDCTRLIGKYLHYDLEHTLATDEEELRLFRTPSFQAVARAMVRDFERPEGDERAFPKVGRRFDDRWKTYCTALGEECGVKGKELYHPMRVCLTGCKAGPDLVSFITLIDHAFSDVGKTVLNPEFKAMSWEDRKNVLKRVLETYGSSNETIERAI